MIVPEFVTTVVEFVADLPEGVRTGGTAGATAVASWWGGRKLARARLEAQLRDINAANERLQDQHEHERELRLEDRYRHAADMLGAGSAATRIAGVRAIAQLADDWAEGRQRCVSVLCSYLSLSIADEDERQVRKTIFDVIADHFRPEATVSWCGLSFDLSKRRIDYLNFDGCQIADTFLDFRGCTFENSSLSLRGISLLDSVLAFDESSFVDASLAISGEMKGKSNIYLYGAKIEDSFIQLPRSVESSSSISLIKIKALRSKISFESKEESLLVISVPFNGEVNLNNGELVECEVNLWPLLIAGTALIDFYSSELVDTKVIAPREISSGRIAFKLMHVKRGEIWLGAMNINGGKIDVGVEFSDSVLEFNGVQQGGLLELYGTRHGGSIDFQGASHFGGSFNDIARYSGVDEKWGTWKMEVADRKDEPGSA